MQSREEINETEKRLIDYKLSSDTIHTELLLDIRDLLIDSVKLGEQVK